MFYVKLNLYWIQNILVNFTQPLYSRRNPKAVCRTACIRRNCQSVPDCRSQIRFCNLCVLYHIFCLLPFFSLFFLAWAWFISFSTCPSLLITQLLKHTLETSHTHTSVTFSGVKGQVYVISFLSAFHSFIHGLSFIIYNQLNVLCKNVFSFIYTLIKCFSLIFKNKIIQ